MVQLTLDQARSLIDLKSKIDETAPMNLTGANRKHNMIEVLVD